MSDTTTRLAYFRKSDRNYNVLGEFLGSRVVKGACMGYYRNAPCRSAATGRLLDVRFNFTV